MSCNFSKKWEPFVIGLVKKVKNLQDPLTEEAAFNKLVEYFGDQAQWIYNTYFEKEGKQLSSFLEYEKVQELKRRFAKEAVDDELSTRANYVGDFNGYAGMITKFKERMIESSVYNRNTGDFVDADQDEDGITHLNRQLFAYKVELINDLLDGVGRPPITVNIDSESASAELTNAIALAKSVYESKNTTKNWDSYVILSHFNDLLKEQTPFIRVADNFKNSTSHGVNMYVYEGPVAHLRQNWSGEDEIPSAESQYSGLAKILLSYIPEVTESGNDIQNAFVESAGFASVMSTMRSALLYSTDPKLIAIREEFFKGAEMDMKAVIRAYTNYLKEGVGFEKPYYSYLSSKLYGIQKYIYNGNMREDIRNMFTRMFFETVPLYYMQYGYFQGQFKGATIKERWIMNQNYHVQGILNGRINTFRSNPKTFDVIRKNYKLEYGNGSNAQNGTIYLTVKDSNNQEKRLGFSYNDKFEIKPVENKEFEDETALGELLYTITGYRLTPEYIGYMKAKHGNKHFVLDDFAPAIGVVIMASDTNKTVNPVAQNGLIDENNNVNFYRMGLYNVLRNISSIDALVKGSETNNTVRDINNNNLPTRGIVSLAYKLREMHRRYDSVTDGFSPAHFNLVHLNMHLLSEPIIREGITVEGKGKKARQLTESELYECTIAYDFLEHLRGDGIIHLQNDTFADKGKHFIWAWNLNAKFDTGDRKLGYIDLFTDLNNLFSNPNAENRARLIEIYKTVRGNQYATIQFNLVSKYNEAFGTEFTTLREVDNYLNENHILYSEVKEKFEALGKFTDEYDAVDSKVGKAHYARINETLLNMLDTFTEESNDRVEKRIERSKRQFLIDLINSGLSFNRFSSKGGKLVYTNLVGANSDWLDTKSGNVILGKAYLNGKQVEIGRHNADILIDPKYTVELNPVLESYFFADVILSNELSNYMVGVTFAHKMKGNEGDPNKKDYDESEYEEFAEATRLIAQIKRNVIPGASMHPMLQGLKYGVAENIKVSIMDDIPGYVYNMIGNKDKVDSSDGSGISNIYQAMMERNSLIDAATGLDMKTIGWDVDPETFIPMMLKWAVYATTNERRRNGKDSDASVEQIHKHLNSDPIRFVYLKKYFKPENGADNFYFFNNETGKYYKITGIKEIQSDGITYFYKTAFEVDDKGNRLPGNEVYLNRDGFEIQSDPIGNLIFKNGIENELGINTIYDIDIFFGGAYSKRLDEKNRLVWSDFNNQMTLEIICSERLKDKMTAYAVNKSAFKVGYGNINSVKSWSDPNSVWKTISMTTRHIGLQMNAEHDLLNAEVTEMTQMISALAENWYTGNIAKQIYKDIGAVVEESLRNINREIEANDMDALRIRLGKALIDAFKTKEETIGLAQAFLAKAEVAMAEADAKVKIPFSASTINGTFISTIVSMLNKKGIRRKYAGIAAVLTPSYNMIQYYRYGNKTVMHDGVSKDIRAWKAANPGFSNTTINDFITKLNIVDDSGIEYQNPFVEDVLDPITLTEGDTIFIIKPDSAPKKVILNNWDDFNTYANHPIEQETIIKRLTIAPRDLKGANTRFNVNGVQFSIYNLLSVQAAHGDENAWNVIKDNAYYAKSMFYETDGKLNIKRSLQNIIQKQLEDLSNGFIVDPRFGNGKTNVTDVVVEAAEIIMGRLNADKFGLQEGDQVQDILDDPDFFYNRWKSNYGEIQHLPEDIYDIVLYSKNGPILVKIGDQPDTRFTRNRNIEIVDDKFIINNSVLCSSEGKQKYSYLAKDNTEYNVIMINSVEQLDDLLDSDVVDTYRVNITNNNIITLGRYFDPKATLLKPNDPAGNLYRYNEFFENSFEERQQKLAKQRYEAFKQSLNLVGARIPTQAMQSFMPLRVVAFTDDTTNVVYVPRMQTWLEGSDYDIDKLYMLAYSIADNGTLPTLSGLSKDFSPAETLRLPIPDGRSFRESKTGYRVSLSELEQVTGMLSTARVGNVKLFNENTLIPNSKYQLEAFRKILEKEGDTISFERPAGIPFAFQNTKDMQELKMDMEINQQLAFEEAKKEFLRLLNRHSRSKSKLNREEALRNNVTFGIFAATTSPVNQINAHMPIEMTETEDAAKKTALSRMEKHVSSDIPSTKYKIQVQAGVGKDVTGISAVSVKVFFAETTYFNDTLSDIIANIKTPGGAQFGLQLLDNLVMFNPIDKTPALVANANVKRILEQLPEGYILSGLAVPDNSLLAAWNSPEGFRIYDCLEYLDKQANVIDCALSESALLSSATDNMKHLILPKLNATAQFVDMYTTMLTHGSTFESIANILTSPLFTAVSKLTQYNIFRNETQGYSVERALGFYLNEDTLPHVNKGLLAKVFTALNIPTKAADVLKLLAYNDVNNTGKTSVERNNQIKKALDYLYNLRDNRFTKWSDDEFDDYFAGYDDIAFDEDDDGRITLESATLEQINILINFLEECITRNNIIVELNNKALLPEYSQYGDAKTQLDNLRIVKEYIIPKTEEQRIFGQMLGINQGIRTDPHAIYSLVRRIENHVNKRMEEKAKVNEVVFEAPFELFKFLEPGETGDTYRQEWISNYDVVKSSFNILRAITKIPHFNTMFDVLFTNNWLLSKFSASYEIVNAIAREIEKRNPYMTGRNYDRVINEREYTQIQRYVNDLFIMGWLSQQNFQYVLSEGSILYTPSANNRTENIIPNQSLKTQYDFATFKNWMESYLIPELQLSSNPAISDNPFIRALEFVSEENKVTKRIEKHYRLPINMMTIDDSVKTQTLYDTYLTGFNDIQNETINGVKLCDLFFLYNLIVNKDGYGQSSMTRIFENLVSGRNGTALINSFYDYISNLDNDIAGRNKMISGIINSSSIRDIQDRIVTYVKGTSIKGDSKAILNMGSDFTFGAPGLRDNWEVVTHDIFDFKDEVIKPFEIKLSRDTVRAGLLSYIKDTFGQDRIKVMTSEQLVMKYPNDPIIAKSSAFIDDGVLYVRSDSENDVAATVHEMVHFILAGMRFNNDPEIRNFYYELLAGLKIEDYRDIIGDDVISEYEAFRTDLDLREEIFAKVVEAYFEKNMLPKLEIGTIIQSNTGRFVDVFNEMFGAKANTEEFFGVLKSLTTKPEVFQVFAKNIFLSDSLEDVVNAVRIAQRVADMRSRMRKENRLEETDC